MNRLQELRLIVKMNQHMGVETEQRVLDEIVVEEQKQQLELVEEEQRFAIKNAFADLTKDLQRLIKEEQPKYKGRNHK